MLLGDLKTWLSPPDPSTNYELGLEAYHRGTATWFIEGKTFQEWDSTGSLLWIHGKRTSFHRGVYLSLMALATHSRFWEKHSLVRHFYVLSLRGSLRPRPALRSSSVSFPCPTAEDLLWPISTLILETK
jgi:hypothetical protein